jgi:hypothetical protein
MYVILVVLGSIIVFNVVATLLLGLIDNIFDIEEEDHLYHNNSIEKQDPQYITGVGKIEKTPTTKSQIILNYAKDNNLQVVNIKINEINKKDSE